MGEAVLQEACTCSQRDCQEGVQPKLKVLFANLDGATKRHYLSLSEMAVAYSKFFLAM